MINNIHDLKQLVKEGFTDWNSLGHVNVKQNGELLLFNYTAKAQFKGTWSEFERMSRGLVIKTDGTVIARPFDKFFNWGQNGQVSYASIMQVWEKMDGSLGIVYAYDGQWHCITRGSFDSEQAQWGTEWIRNKLPKPTENDYNYTYLFEIIYPGNRIVVDYDGYSGMVLLQARWTQSDESTLYQGLCAAHEIQEIALRWGLDTPQVYTHYNSVHQIMQVCKELDVNHEGFVVQFSDGQLFKFKGDAYKELHRSIYNLSYKRAVEAVRTNTVDDIRESIPDEFLEEFNDWVQKIELIYLDMDVAICAAFNEAPKDNRKEFAQWVQSKTPDLAPYMFAKLDNKDYRDIIFRKEFN